MKVKYIISLLLILSAILIFFIVTKTTFNNNTEPFKAAIYQTNTGFGYSISYNDILLIKQDYIPTIQNNQSFCSYQDAQNVANLVLEKLYKKVNPKISLLELKQLGIQLNCIN
tara:strand:+ start:6489 stop:6827 length:339 start_codon:yes stop_codon:yes gene_type:complete